LQLILAHQASITSSSCFVNFPVFLFFSFPWKVSKQAKISEGPPCTQGIIPTGKCRENGTIIPAAERPRWASAESRGRDPGYQDPRWGLLLRHARIACGRACTRIPARTAHDGRILCRNVPDAKIFCASCVQSQSACQSAPRIGRMAGARPREGTPDSEADPYVNRPTTPPWCWRYWFWNGCRERAAIGPRLGGGYQATSPSTGTTVIWATFTRSREKNSVCTMCANRKSMHTYVRTRICVKCDAWHCTIDWSHWLFANFRTISPVTMHVATRRAKP
jgi:hypothetical protein